MQRPFPALRHLQLWLQPSRPWAGPMQVAPDSFLGGSAPHLQTLSLCRIPFPGLPKLLLSATHLQVVCLDLWDISHTGYISPDTLLTCLSVLTRLEKLKIGFENSPGRDDRKSGRSLPLTRSLLLVLTMFQFKGDSEYLENLLVGIGVPLLDELDIVFFHRTTLSTPQLTQLISRTTQFMGLDRACFKFDSSAGSRRTPLLTFGNSLNYGISGGHSHSRVWALVRACSSSVPPALVSRVKFLHILEEGPWLSNWKRHIERNQWVQLLHPFTGVEGLYLSNGFVPIILSILRELVGERGIEVLPALQTLFLEGGLGTAEEDIRQFVVARQLVHHPITVSGYDPKDA